MEENLAEEETHQWKGGIEGRKVRQRRGCKLMKRRENMFRRCKRDTGRAEGKAGSEG